MARTIRFHLDENCAAAIAVGLRRQGVDVTTTPEGGLLGASDADHVAFAFALDDGRVIFTQDGDFLRIHNSGVEHPGIVYCPKDSRTLGQVIDALQLIWEVCEPEEMIYRVEFI